MNTFLIVNTRTDGANPNVLCAQMEAETFTPLLVVANDNNFPSPVLFTNWSFVFAGGSAYHLQICDANNNPYYLGVTSPDDGADCILVPASEVSSDTYTEWTFSYSTRILLAQTGGTQYSLSAGQYPAPTVENFDSSENQTWQFGIYMNFLSGFPPGITAP